MINTILMITIQITTIDRYIYPWYTLYKNYMKRCFMFSSIALAPCRV
ncbi:hypothetical protein HMPREF1548_04575 [Clostridium sp. KLE 1755]|nr:hypothetical protein HMPREF1548_04575 [Clostridium sp. KLE 1755]